MPFSLETDIPRRPSLVAYGHHPIAAFAIDAEDIYWTTFEGEIWTLNLRTSARRLLLSGSERVTDITLAGGYLYWVSVSQTGERPERFTSTLRRIPVTGGSPEDITDANPWGALARDATHIYWVTAFKGTLARTPIAGGASTPTGASLQGAVHGPLVSGDRVFWTENREGRRARGMAVMSAPIAGGLPVMIAFEEEGICALAVSEWEVVWGAHYWHQVDERMRTQASLLKKAPVESEGGDVIELADRQPGDLKLAIHRDTVYWTNQLTSTIMAMPLEAPYGEPETLATQQGTVSHIAVSDAAIAWTNGGGNIAVLWTGEEGQGPKSLENDPSAPFHNESRSPEDDEFDAEVERTCRLREGPEGQIERVYVSFSAPFQSFLRTREMLKPWYPWFQHVIAVRRPDASIFDAFERAIAIDRNTIQIGDTTVVYNGAPPADDLVKKGAALKIRFESIGEYKGLIDVSAYKRSQRARLDNDATYAPNFFVDQRAYRMNDALTELDPLAHLSRALCSKGGCFALLLGDPGAGKSFLLRELARSLEASEDGPMPLVIDMTLLEHSVPQEREQPTLLDKLFSRHFRALGVSQVDCGALRDAIAAGRIALLLDNADFAAGRTRLLPDVSGLAPPIDYGRAPDELAALFVGLPRSSKVVVTSRSAYFLSADDARAALERSAPDPGCAFVMTLLPFSAEQRKSALSRRAPAGAEADANLRTLDRELGGLEILANPRMLSAAAAVIKEDTVAHTTEGAAAQRGPLMARVLDGWHVEERRSFDHTRDHHTGGSSRQVLRRLAKWLWLHGQTSAQDLAVPEELLRSAPHNGVVNVEPSQMAHRLGWKTLLSRDLGGKFSFLHPSIIEWLAAQDIAEAYEASAHRGEGSTLLLGARRMSPRMIDFFIHFAGQERAMEWANAALARRSLGVLEENARAILERLGVAPGRPTISGASLQGIDFTKKDLRSADLAGACLANKDLADSDLSGAILAGADLAGASLVRASLRRANLAGASLTGADLAGADLAGASLVGADLRGASLRGASFRAAKLMGATLDEGALDDCDTFGAALSIPHRINPMVLLSCPVQSLAWTPRGDFLVTGHADGSTRVWETETGACLRVTSGAREARRLAISPDGSTLAVCGNSSVPLLDIATGASVGALRGHRTSTTDIAWSADGAFIVTASYDSTVRLWDAKKGATLRIFREAGGGAPMGVALSPDGAIVATVQGRAARLWSASTGAELHELEGLSSGADHIAFSPDGKLVVSAGESAVLCIWDTATGALVRSLTPPRIWLQSMAISPDFQRLAIGSSGQWSLIDMQTSERLRAFQGQSETIHVAFRPDGAELATGAGDGTVRIWSVATGAERLALKANADSPSLGDFVDGGATLITKSTRAGARFWDVKKVAVRDTPMAAEGATKRALAPAAGDSRADEPSNHAPGGRAARLHELPTNVRAALNRHGIRGSTEAIWSPDRSFLVVGGGLSADSVSIVDATTGEVRHTLKKGSRMLVVALSPDATRIALLEQFDDELSVWDTNTGESLIEIQARALSAKHVAWSPDGKMLALSGRGLAFFDAATGAPIPMRVAGDMRSIETMRFSPDGALIAIERRWSAPELLNALTWDRLAVLVPLPEGWVAFNRDGAYKSGGVLAGAFWHSIGLCRFEPGELDPYTPEPFTVAADAPLPAPRPLDGTEITSGSALAEGAPEPLSPAPAPIERRGPDGSKEPLKGGDALWSRRFSGADDQDVDAMAVDPAGNTTLVGSFEDRLNLGPPIGVASGKRSNTFALRLDPSGAPSRIVIAEGVGYWHHVAHGPTGALAFDVCFQGTIEVGGEAIRSKSTQDILLFCKSAGGELIYRKQFGVSEATNARGLAMDDDGGVVLVGETYGVVDFGGGSIGGPGRAKTGFVTRLDASGSHVFTKSFPTASLSGCALDKAGSIMLHGSFQESMSFGGPALEAVGRETLFLAKLDRFGNHVWSRRIGSPDSSGYFHIAVSDDGSVYLFGFFCGTWDFDGKPLVLGDNVNLVVMKLNPSGEPLWSHVFSGAQALGASAIAISASGDALCAGTFLGTIDFGVGPLTSANTRRNAALFLVKLDAAGRVGWSKCYGSGERASFAGVQIDGAGHALVVGTTVGDIDLGAGSMPGTGRNDIIIAKLVM